MGNIHLLVIGNQIKVSCCQGISVGIIGSRGLFPNFIRSHVQKIGTKLYPVQEIRQKSSEFDKIVDNRLPRTHFRIVCIISVICGLSIAES